MLILILPPKDFLNVDQRGIAKAPTINSEITGTDKPPETKPTSLQIPPYTKEGLREFAKEIAIQYGLDYEQVKTTLNCESGFSADPPHNNLSRGVAQFMPETWLGNCSNVDDRLDPYKSIDCLGKMWAKGMQSHWDCWCLSYGRDNLQCQKRGF